VDARELGLDVLAVGKAHPDDVRLLDDMRVGEDVAARVDDDTAARTDGLRPVVRRLGRPLLVGRAEEGRERAALERARLLPVPSPAAVHAGRKLHAAMGARLLLD